MITLQGKVIEQLLSGQFICRVSNEEGFEFLADESNKHAVEQHLKVLNRTLANTVEGEVYFSAYQTLAEDERKVLSAQFQETSSSLIPLVEWLLLVQEAQGTDMPLSMGNSIRLSELQMVIEDTPALSEQIARISHYKTFGSHSNDLDAQLKQVFKRLVDMGYLTKPNSEKAIFLVTGKIEYLFEVIKFIDETESLHLAEKAEDAMAQASLL